MDSFQIYLQQFLNLLGIPYLLEAFHATLEYFQSLLVTGQLPTQSDLDYISTISLVKSQHRQAQKNTTTNFM